MSSTTTLNGVRLGRMIIAGANELAANKQLVDAMNVFPVPDGDTGTNMSLTMMSAVKEISTLTDTSMATFADKLAKGALRGARGNSGVILSQILKGFSNVIAKCDDVNTRQFANGLKRILQRRQMPSHHRCRC